MNKIMGCFLALMIAQFVQGQPTRYIIQLKDKATNPFSLSNPFAYLSQKAIDRRIHYSISLDSTDLPVTPRYVDSIRLAGAVTILNVSRWLNAVSIQTSDATALSRINQFPFVRSVSAIAMRLNTSSPSKFREERTMLTVPLREMGTSADFYNYGNGFAQIHLHNGEFLHNIGLRGQGVIIGMLDAGYQSYLTLPAFDSVRKNGHVLDTWDFVSRNASVNEDDSHGMECFSTMASNIPGQFVGTAPGASFFLYRTEDASSEFPIEEHNWVCGAERIDSAGGDVISTSLGYTVFDPPFNGMHNYSEMDGNTTMGAIGADLAAKKGLLVVVSAGNEGTSSWHYISTPADADSVLCVGAVSTSGAVGSFSGYGPSSDGQIKPDLMAVGVSATVQFPNNTIGANNGTSFSTPIIAGLASCLWEGFPEYNNMKIIQALRNAGSNTAAPDNHIGYGIPDVKKAVMNLLKEFAHSSASVTNCISTFDWTSKDMNAMRYEIERMLPGQSSFTLIAKQSGSGNIFGNRDYQYEDVLSDGVPAGTISYRIKEIIDTSSTALTADYIDTASVVLAAGCLPSSNYITLLSNPAQTHSSVKVTTVSAVDQLVILLYDAKGSLVYQANESKPAGSVVYELPVNRIASGKYYVVVYNHNSLIGTRELIKL
ncbi:MAG: S8 family serine peptidase [Flavisolibacter sp.]